MEVAPDFVAVAESCHRLAWATASRPYTGWDGLAAEEQTRWLRVARNGPGLLSRMEGSPLSAVAGAVRDLYAGEAAGRPSPAEALAWEAVARHLWVLTDCEDLHSVEDSERQWLEWFQRKAGPLQMAG